MSGTRGALRTAADKAYDTYLGLGLPRLRPQAADDAERGESEWASGVWQYLDRPHELGRYSLLAGYCRYFAGPRARVLDLGCGDGLMRGQLEHFASYLGVDVSPTAVRLATARWQDERTSFLVGEASTVAGPFDVVIANELLQMVDDPAAIAAGAAGLVKPGGYFLASIHWDTPRNRALWKQVDARFTCLDAVRLKSEKVGRTWRVACYQKAA